MNRITKYPLAGITAINGQRAVSDMRNGRRTTGVFIRIQASLQIAVAPVTTILNGGTVLSLVDFVGINENGEDRVLLNGRLAGYVGRVNNVVDEASFTRLTSTAIGTTQLDETIYIPFGPAWQVSRGETAYVEKDPRVSLQAFVQWNPTVANIVTAGGATVTIGTPTITVWQEGDDERQKHRPLFVPFYREQSLVVSASGLQPPMYLKTSRFIRALAIMQDTNVGFQSDIITNVILKGDTRDFIAPPGGTIGDLARMLESSQNAPAADDPGFLYLNFAEGGRLSNVLSPINDANVRFEFTAAPSAAAGATSSIIRVGILELERVTGLTADRLNFAA
jgi:hypothetical protein